MKKSIRFISLLIAVVFLISGAVMVICHAEGENPPANNAPAADNNTPAVDNNTPAADNNTPAADNNTPAAGNDGSNDAGVNNNAGNAGNVDNGDNSNNAGNSGYDSGYDAGYNSDYNSGYDNSYNNSNNNYANQVEDSDPIYYGDASQYSYNANVESGEVTPNAASSNTTLYNSSGMSAAEAAPNEWSDIKLDEKTVKTGVSDFSAIKENTEVVDNGYWILYLGYALLALSGLGILYFIVATIIHRSAVRREERNERKREGYAPSRSAVRAADDAYREPAPARRTSRFADEDTGSYRRRSHRSDTGEVYVPRRAAGKSR